jgi:hypothetical protein
MPPKKTKLSKEPVDPPRPTKKKTAKTKAELDPEAELAAKRDAVQEFDKVVATEVQRQSEIQKTEELNEKYRIKGLDELCSMKAGQAFNWLYRLDTNVKFDGDEYKNARDWWERADAVQQCKNTIGDKVMTEECYICGLRLNEDTGAKKTPECEHILPVFQGALFLNLYRSEYKDIVNKANRRETLTAREQHLYDTLMLEYKWAHRCCNQIKSNISFLTFDPKDNKFKLDFVSSKKILKGVFEAKMPNKNGVSENRAYCNVISGILKKKYGAAGVDKFIRDRSDAINDANIKPICKEIHRQMGADKRKGLFYLSVLSTLITAADSNRIAAAQAAAAGEELKKPPPAEAVEKAQIYAEVSSKVSKIICDYNWGTWRRDVKDANNAILREIISTTDKTSWLLNSQNKPDVNLISKLLVESLVDGSLIVSRKSNTSLMRYKSIYRDLFCIFAYPPHTGSDRLVHQPNKPQVENYKKAGTAAAYATKAVLLSAILNKISAILESIDKKSEMARGLEKIYDIISDVLGEAIDSLRAFENYLLLLFIVLKTCERFGKDIEVDFVECLGEELRAACLKRAAAINAEAKFLSDENLLHGRAEYYQFYSGALTGLDVNEDENVHLLEVSAVNRLKEMNAAKQVFLEMTEEEPIRPALIHDFVETELNNKMDVFSRSHSPATSVESNMDITPEDILYSMRYTPAQFSAADALLMFPRTKRSRSVSSNLSALSSTDSESSSHRTSKRPRKGGMKTRRNRK